MQYLKMRFIKIAQEQIESSHQQSFMTNWQQLDFQQESSWD